MEKPIRIHLGEGRHKWPNNWVGVDIVGNPDIKSDVTKLPMFEDNTVDEIQAIHLFEHISRLEAPYALSEWYRILKPGGKLVMEMPSMDKIAKMLVNGETNVRLTLLGIFGDPRENDPYMLHQWCYTDKEICFMLKESGFSATVEEPLFHIPARDMRVIGVK